MLGCVRLRCCAAAWKLPRRAMHSKVRIWAMVIDIGAAFHKTAEQSISPTRRLLLGLDESREKTVTEANVVKEAAASGSRIRGVHLTFAAPTVIELLARHVDFIY